jgi:glycosyltransferase involved in cell wall biosynthesis
MNVLALIPAWNEERTIADVVRSALPYARVVVIDDGSTDRTSELARAAGATVIRHRINRGLGAALGTGFAVARRLHADITFTFDGDGQHVANDIPKMLAPVVAGTADVVIGSRFSGIGHMPGKRRLANRIGNLVTFVLFGVHVTDSQSGFRAFSRTALKKIEIATDGMEVSSEIIAEIHDKKLRVQEVPIAAVYTAYSLSKGQSFWMGLRTLAKLLLYWGRR